MVNTRTATLKTTAALAAILWTALAAGCGKQNTAATPPPTTGAHKPQVALVMKSLANEFFKTMEQGAEANQKQNASEYDLIANGIENEQDVNKQVELMEQMISRHVDAIVLAPADSKALVPVCKQAQDAGIVVINIDNKLDADALKEKGARVPFVGPDNRKGAKLAGDYLAKTLRPGDEVALVDGLPGAYNAAQRHLGFSDAMIAAKANVIASQPADWDTTKANRIVGAILPQHPQIKAILCANDSMALGAVAALGAAGKLKQVQVVGFDDIAAVQQLIRQGQVLCTVDQHGDQIAVNGITYALDILKKTTTPQDRETPVDLITAQTLAAGKH